MGGDRSEDRADEDRHLVVYVEDNPDTIGLVTWILEATGRYRVLGAQDGVAGLKLIKTRRPHLVLLDLDLPLVSGIELAQRVRSDPELAAIPMVAVTASVMNSEKERCLRAGCRAFVEKPFDIDTLRSVVDAYVSRAPLGARERA